MCSVQGKHGNKFADVVEAQIKAEFDPVFATNVNKTNDRRAAAATAAPPPPAVAGQFTSSPGSSAHATASRETNVSTTMPRPRKRDMLKQGIQKMGHDVRTWTTMQHSNRGDAKRQVYVS